MHRAGGHFYLRHQAIINSMAVTGLIIVYDRTLSSPFDALRPYPSVHRSIPILTARRWNLVELVASLTRLYPQQPLGARPAPARGIRDAIYRPAIVGPPLSRHEARSSAKTRWCRLGEVSSAIWRLLEVHRPPTSTTTPSRRSRPYIVVAVSMGATADSDAQYVSAEYTSFVQPVRRHGIVLVS